jgi:hypothetical protein
MVLILACIALNYPAFVSALELHEDEQSVVLIPKVVDANRMPIGYIFYNNMAGINYNGQIILLRMHDGYFDERALYFEDDACSGTPYLIVTNGDGLGWENIIGYVNNGNLYFTIDNIKSSKSIEPRSIQFSNGTCAEKLNERRFTMQAVRRVCSLSKFVTPYKIRYGSQNDFSLIESLRYLARGWLTK